jgi:hypothetical protein
MMMMKTMSMVNDESGSDGNDGVPNLSVE